MVLSLIVVVRNDWQSLSRSTQVVYGVLVLLALYTGVRGLEALGCLSRQRPEWRRAYIGHVGFTLISLFDGFVIVGALDLNAPGWLVAAVGVLGIVIGISVIQAASRVYGETAATGTPNQPLQPTADRRLTKDEG
jgi:xanthosine utilization system XapX-like protein